MKSHAKAVVIGGGVVGCSVLFHLAKAGWKDVMLIERSELTSGSSWHAAGGFHTLNGDPNVAKLQAYTVQLYREIEELSGQNIGLHLTGGVMMADTKERMDFLRLAHAKGRYLGMDTELITPSEAKAMFPLMDETHFVGAMWDPVEGHLDPSGTTHAYAKAAQKLGAEIVLRNRVIELTQETDGTWNVVTEQGTVKAEHVVNCGGLWAREVGRMVGLELPLLAMEHMYLLTEDMPEVMEYNKSTGRELIGVIDFKGEIYTRQERNGILLGTYEKACKPWSEKETPWSFGHELLAARHRPHRAVAGSRLPPFPGASKRPASSRSSTAPSPSRRTATRWSARCRASPISGSPAPSWPGSPRAAASGWRSRNGWSTATRALTSGAWMSPATANGRRCATPMPRCARTIPAASRSASPTRNSRRPPAADHTALRRDGARQQRGHGRSWGLEIPLWFAPKGTEARDIVSFHRSNDFEHVGNEVRKTRKASASPRPPISRNMK